MKFSHESFGTALYVKETTYDGGKEFTSAVKTLDGGASWESVGMPLGVHLFTYSDSEDAVLGGSDNGSVLYRKARGLYYRSLDNGVGWELPRYSLETSRQQVTTGYIADARSRLSMYLAAISPYDSRTIFASFFMRSVDAAERIAIPGIYVSHDAGDHWRLFSDKLESASPLGISPSDPKTLIGITHEGPIKTRDGGKIWYPMGEQDILMAPLSKVDMGEESARASALGVSPQYTISQAAEYAKAQIWDIVFQEHNPSLILIVANKGLLQSTDGGNSWNLLKVGVDQANYVTSALYDPDNPQIIYVGTQDYVAKSTDGGCSFHKVYPK